MYKLVILFLLLSTSIAAFSEEEMLNSNTEETALNQDGEIVEENFIHDKSKATIQVLNKITAKANYLEIPIKSEVILGTLLIKVNACWKASPYDLSENKILLNIAEKKIGQKEYKTIFNGWMFSSSPGISSLEHSVYDVIAINCYN